MFQIDLSLAYSQFDQSVVRRRQRTFRLEHLPAPPFIFCHMNYRLNLTRLLLVPAAVLILVSHHIHRENSFWDTLLSATGILLLVTAAGGRIWASTYLAGNKKKRLIVEGPYSIVRNPLYLFSLIGFAGAGLAFESLTLALLFCLIFALTHTPAMAKEERALNKLFPGEYKRYRQEVPSFIPKIRRIRTSENISVNMVPFSTALRDCMAIPLILIVAIFLEWAKINGFLPVLIHIV